jgi:hypothetical protein
MAQALETDRRQHLRDGILEFLGDIANSVLRKHGVDPSSHSTVSESAVAATATS